MKKVMGLMLVLLLPLTLLGASVQLTPADVAALQAGGSISITVLGPPVVVVPPPVPPTTGATYVLYADGVFKWPGDYSYPGGAITIAYKDTVGKPTTGTYDLAVIGKGQWFAWQPYAPNWNFDITPYAYLQFDAKTTVANQQWNLFALQVGDINITDVNGAGVAVDINKYGPTPGVSPVPGSWKHYKVRLADFMTNKGVLLKAMYKFDIHDETGLSVNTFYLNNVQFTAN